MTIEKEKFYHYSIFRVALQRGHEVPGPRPPVFETGESPPLPAVKFQGPLRLYSNGAERERSAQAYVNENNGRGYSYEIACMEFLVRALPKDYFVIGPNILDGALGSGVNARRGVSIPDFLIFRRMGEVLVLKAGAEAKVNAKKHLSLKTKVNGFAQLVREYRKDSSELRDLITDNIGQVTLGRKVQNRVVIPPKSEIEFAILTPTRPPIQTKHRGIQERFSLPRSMAAFPVVYITVPLPTSPQTQVAA